MDLYLLIWGSALGAQELHPRRPAQRSPPSTEATRQLLGLPAYHWPQANTRVYRASEKTFDRIFGEENGDYNEVCGLKTAHFFKIFVFLADKFCQKLTPKTRRITSFVMQCHIYFQFIRDHLSNQDMFFADEGCNSSLWTKAATIYKDNKLPNSFNITNLPTWLWTWARGLHSVDFDSSPSHRSCDHLISCISDYVAKQRKGFLGQSLQ